MNNLQKVTWKKYFFYRALYLKKKLLPSPKKECWGGCDTVIIKPYSEKKTYWLSNANSNPKVLPQRHSLFGYKVKFFLIKRNKKYNFPLINGIGGRTDSVGSKALGAGGRGSSKNNVQRGLVFLEESLNTLYVRVHILNNSDLISKVTGVLLSNMFQYDPFSLRWYLNSRDLVLNFLAKNLRFLSTLSSLFLNISLPKPLKVIRYSTSSLTLGKLKGLFFIKINVFANNIVLCRKINHLLLKNIHFFTHQHSLYFIDKNLVGFLLKLEFFFINKKIYLLNSFKYYILPSKVISTYTILRYFLGNIKIPSSWVRVIRFLNKEFFFGDSFLKKYQRRGVLWMTTLHKIGAGGILADEMGLGKTIQSLSFIDTINPSHLTPNLIVCPKGLAEVWIKECLRFNLKDTHTYLFNNKAQLYKKSLYNFIKKKKKLTLVLSFNFLESNYFYFYNIQYNSTIIDEAHILKNNRGVAFFTLKKLSSFSKFLLTGTPFKNRLSDIFYLNSFVQDSLIVPKFFFSKRLKSRLWLSFFLKKNLLFFFLRRLKRKSLTELPTKTSFVVILEMTFLQKNIYKKLLILERSLSFLKKIVNLRYLCVDPRIKNPLVSSPKSKFLIRTLRVLLFTGKKVIVYSQFIHVLSNLKSDLKSLSIDFLYIDGNVLERLNVCDRFNFNKEVSVLIVSVKAAGLGFTINSANVVVHLDVWWNVSLEHQSTDRSHRIGQKNKLINIKLLMNNSIETKTYSLQNYKRGLFFNFFSK